MKEMARRAVAVILSSSLVLTTPGSVAFAQKHGATIVGTYSRVYSEEETSRINAELEKMGVFSGPDDPLRTYIGKKNLTPLGETLYKYLKNRPNPGEDIDAMKDGFESLRKAGPFNEKKQAAIDGTIERYQAKFGSIPGPANGDPEDVFRLGALREAMMTNAAVADPPKKAMTQVELEDGSGWAFLDDEGLAFKLNRNQITTYNRELQKQQKDLNRTRPPQAPFIPETGRYNIQMIELSYWRIKLQSDELLRAYRMDRMISMAELLGKQYKEDMWFKDLTLEADLEKWAKEKTYKHSDGKTYSVYDIVDAKTKARKVYLDKALEGVANFKGDMEKLRGNDTITDSKLSAMQVSEQYVLRYLSLVFLESQKFFVKNQLERLDPKSPDSQMLVDAIRDAPMDEARRKKYKEQGDVLRARLLRLQTIFATVQDSLLKSDYAGSMVETSSALNSTQQELQEISLDYQLYVDAPSLSMLGKTQTGSALPSFNGSFNPKKWEWGFARYVTEKTGIVPGHTGRMESVRKFMPQLDRITTLVSEGKYWQARVEAAQIFPEAAKTYGELGMGNGSPKITAALKTTSSLSQARKTLMKVAEVNKWADTIGNFAAWTLSMAAGGPLISRTLSGLAKGLRALEIPKLPALSKYTTNLLAEAFEHTATRINSLNPAPENLTAKSFVGRYAQASYYRGLSFAGRQASFTMLSGVISGGFTVAGHLMDEAPFKLDLGIMKFGEGHSNFTDSGQAFSEGFTGGLHWANESFHPMLGYVGLPSSAFEGGRLAFYTQTLGERGVVGTMGEVAKRWGLPISEKLSLNTLASKGFVGQGLSFGLGMVDNVSKYALFSQGIGKAAEYINWHRNYDEKDVERRIKRAQKEGMAWMESPAWLLLPVFPAKYEEAAAGYQRSLQGAKEYLNSPDPSLRAKLANAPDESYLPLLSSPKVPAMQVIFNLTVKGARQSDKNFLVSKDIKRQAIAAELKAVVPENAPMEFFKISQLDPKKTPKIGNNLYLTDDVKLVAREKFADALRGNQKLTEQILNAKHGETVKGFGVITPGLQREVAVTMHLEKAAGKKISPAVAEKAAKILDRYLQADNMGGPAKKFLDAIKARNDSGAVAEKFDSVVKKQLETVAEWKRATDKGETSETYMGVLKKLRENADDLLKKGEVSAKQHEALRRWYEYIEAGEARFQAFNNVEMTHTLVSEELSALQVQYGGAQGSGSPAMKNLLDGFAKKIETWKNSYAGPKEKVEAPGERRFKNLMSELQGQLDGAKDIKPAEREAIKGALKEMKASPWILHDSKGTALSGWRPGQFESLMESLGKAIIQGQNGAPIREFIRLTTGGGKTLLTFEGLLPLAEADAAANKMKVSFLTVQSNLEAQARLEFMSLKKIGSKLEFDTYEGFKSQIAEAKSKGDTFIEKNWILGDEMDGAALQPALTLGETTGRITRKNSAYARIEEIYDFMTGLLGKRTTELGENIKLEARSTQAIIDGLPPGSPEIAAARKATEKLLRSAESLGNAKTPEARLKAQEQVADALGELRAASMPQALPKAVQGEFLATFAILKDGEIVGARLTKKQVAQIEAMYQEKIAALKGQNGPQAKALRESVETTITKVREAKTAAELKAAVKEGIAGQRRILDSEPSLSGEQRSSIESSIAKVNELLSHARKLEGARERRLRLEGELSQVKKDIKLEKNADAKERMEDRRSALENELDAVKSLEADFSAGLVHQQNLLGLIRDNPKARLDALKLEARKQLEAAERRVERLKREAGSAKGPEKKAALEAELALAQKELALAQRFQDAGLARAQKLVEKVAELKDAGGEKLAKAEAELAAVTESLSLRDQAKLEAYSKEVGALREAVVREAMDEVTASQARLKAMRREAVERKIDSGELAEVRKQFKDSGEEIMALLNKGEAGAEGEAAVLLKRRQELMEAFASSENKAYSVFRKMKEDAYSFARNLLLENAEGAAGRARESTVKLVEEHVSAIKSELKSLETAPAGELKTRAETLLKEQLASWEKLPKDGDVLGGALDISMNQVRERKDLSKALGKQRSSMDSKLSSALESTLTTLAQRDAALSERLADVSKTLKLSSEDTIIAGMAKKIDGGFSPVGTVKLLWQAFTGQKVNVKVDKVGLTRMYAAELLGEILRDPVMPSNVRDQMFWEVLPSLLMPRGPTGRGTSYVREEFMNMIRGYYDNPAGIRIDNISGKINVIHNGQWFETMDNPTRRFWEVHYGTDLTLKYTHKSLSTIKDVTANKKARFISLSATAGEKYKQHLEESGVVIGGQGASSPPRVDLAVHHGETSKTTSISQALRRVVEESKKRVAFRPAEVLDPMNKAPQEVRDYLEATGIAKKESLAMDLSAFPEGAVRDYMAKLRSMQGDNTGLVVLSLSDTVMLKKIRNYLIKSGALKENEIAQVFSDAEWLRINRPEAKVHEQMNLDGMPSGKVKILLLDTRVGGRGLDLDYKGLRSSTKLQDFKGYTNYEMLVIDPHEMSAVHLLQAQGRIDVGRVLPGAVRRFELVMDVASVQKEHHFKEMFNDNPFFVALREEAGLKEFARREEVRLGKKVQIDWAFVDTYIKNFERQRLAELGGDPAVQAFAREKGRPMDLALIRDYVAAREAEDAAWAAKWNLVEKYEATVRKTLADKQERVEEDQLRSSSVLQDRPIVDHRLRWLDILSRGGK